MNIEVLKEHKDEIWKEVKIDNKIILISSHGRIAKIFKNQLRKSDRYLRIGLSVNNKTKSFSVHRLVAMTFIDNPKNKATVNHKDGNKTNNYVINLEWMTHLENIHHAFEHNLIPKNNVIHWNINNKKIKVDQYDKDNNFIKTWESMMSVERTLGLNHRNICFCCKKRRKTCGGFKWEYSEKI